MVETSGGDVLTDYLRPKVRTGNLAKRQMEDGLFRNPPTYTELGGFSAESKYTDPSGKRQKLGALSLERGGPSSQKGKPI
jgi:hypothetical protein